MALNERQADLLRNLVSRGILDKPKLGSMKAPKIPTQAPLRNRNTDYASYLLSGALESKGVGKAMSRALASNKSAEEEEQSALTKLFDTLLIPNYTAANVGDAIASGMDEEDSFLENVGDVFGGVGEAVADAGQAISSKIFGRGLTRLPFVGDKFEETFESSPFQQEKKTFQNVLNERFGVENKFLRHGGGFALDIALDPLTYVGVGLGTKGAKAGKSAVDTLTDKATVPESILKPQVNLAKPSVAEDAMKGGTVPFIQESVPKLPRISLKAPNNLERTAQYENWLKSEISKLKQRNTVSPGRISFSREDGRRIARLERELRILQDSASESFYAGDDLFKNASLRELLDDTSLVDEFDAISPPKSVKIDEPTTPLTRRLQRRQNTPTGLTPAQMRVAKQQPLPKLNDLTERLVRRQKDWERSMTKLGKVTEGTRLNMRAANKVVQEIQAGRVPRVLPKPPVVQGPAVDRAKDIADDVIDSLMGQKKIVGKKNIRWQGPDGKYRTRKLPVELTAGMQVSMAGKVLAATGPKNLDEAVGVLRAAEDHMISLGVQPVRHEGVRVRLSDVLNLLKDRIDTEIPFETILNNFARKNMKDMNPSVREAIQTVAAYRSSTMADILENLTARAEKAKRGIADSYVGSQKAVAEAQLIDDSIAAAHAAGMTKGELQKVKDLIKDVVDVDKLPVEKFFTTASKELSKAFDEGRASGVLISKFNKLVAESFGYGTKANVAEMVSGSRVVDTLMGSFVTHWGKGHLFPKARGLFDAGEQIARGRAEALRKQSQKYTKEEIANAWKVVTGNADTVVADARTLEMANWFRGYFTEVLKTPKYGLQLTNPATKHLSVAERDMLLMKDVNRHLRDMQGSHAFQFTNKNFQRDAWGVQRHFGQEGWLASWARVNPEDPLKFLYDIDLALERATREYAFLDNFVATFGSLSKDSYHNYQMGAMDRIADFHVPKDIGLQMTRIMQDIHKGHWGPRTPLTRFYSKGLRVWKTSVTIYLPSHHIRNGIGDMYLMWLAGHNNPLMFKNAARIMHSQKGRYQAAIKSGDFATIGQMTDPGAMKLAATRGGDVILNINGQKVTAEQLYVNAFHRGLLKDANQLEDIFGESRIGIKPLGGKAHAAATGAAEYREHFIRLSHFTSAVQKSLKKGRKDLDKIYDDAANEVRKWHPDGTDLTYFEEKYMRQIIPFYSWLRKSTPLLVESLVTRPGKNLAYPRGMVALQNMMGVESTMADPFPDDQLFPEWLKESGIGPIGDPLSPNPFTSWWGNLGRNMINIEGDPYGYTSVNPSNPFVDQGRTILGYGGTPRDLVKGIFDQMTPAVKIPVELGATGREFTGAPIYEDEGGRGVGQYLMKQFGATAPVQRFFDVGEKERVGVEPQKFDLSAFLNNLTALGVYGTGPYIKSAEFEEKERLAAQKKKEANK